MSVENPLWGAPCIHGELLKLGFEVAQSSVAKYMVKRPGHPARDGELSCATTRPTLPPWTCSLFQLNAAGMNQALDDMDIVTGVRMSVQCQEPT